MRSQHIPFQLRSRLSAHRRRTVVLDPHALRAGALLRRGHAPRVRKSHAPRRKARERDELLSGARYRHRRTGRHRQHRRRVRRDPDRRPRRDFLDVGHRLFRHGDHLCRGDARADHPADRQRRRDPRRPGLLHHDRLQGRLRKIPRGLLRCRHHPCARLYGMHGAVQLHRINV